MDSFQYKPVRACDKQVFDRYLSGSGKQSADYAFANLFAWSGFYRTLWAEVENFLILRFQIAGSEKHAYLEPIGSGSADKALDFIRKDAQRLGEPLRLFSLSKEFADYAQSSKALPPMRFYTNRDFGNYIYSRKSLETLEGKKLHAKRNHIAKFRQLYPNFRALEICPKRDFSAIQKLTLDWSRAQGKETTTVLEERRMIETALAHYRELELFGILLTVEEKPVAFSFGSFLTNELFCVHAEKADTAFEGSYAVICQLLAKALPQSVKSINREEDMGLPSLRKAKLSYRPEKITEEFFAFERDSVEADIWELWKENFPEDDDAFLTGFIHPYSNEASRITLYETGVLASMLHRFEMQSDWGKVQYIYGLATRKGFEHRGFATSLIERTLREARKSGAVAVWTIPENRSFTGWKRLNFGELSSEPLSFETDDGFSFGGEPLTDFGVFRITHMPLYLSRFTAEHPDIQATVSVEDPLFSENSGTYLLEGGQSVKRSDRFERKALRPEEIAARFSLQGGKHLVYPVVSGQR